MTPEHQSLAPQRPSPPPGETLFSKRHRGRRKAIPSGADGVWCSITFNFTRPPETQIRLVLLHLVAVTSSVIPDPTRTQGELILFISHVSCCLFLSRHVVECPLPRDVSLVQTEYVFCCALVPRIRVRWRALVLGTTQVRGNASALRMGHEEIVDSDCGIGDDHGPRNST